MKGKIIAAALTSLFICSITGTASAAWTEFDSETYSASATVESEPNSAPVSSSPSPADGATGVSVDTSTWSCTITDPDGDSMDWSIETSPAIGSNSGTGATNGSISCSLSGLAYSTAYTVYVNVTDGTDTTNDIYTFTTESEPEPTWTEYDTATYSASATVESDSDPASWTEYDTAAYNAIANITAENQLNSPPTASFTYTTSELTASFTDTSTDSDGVIVNWTWDFGDGQTSTLQHNIHTYSAEGTYNVTLTVTDDDGATNATTQAVMVSVGGGGDTDLISYDINTIYVAIGAVVAVAVAALFFNRRRH